LKIAEILIICYTLTERSDDVTYPNEFIDYLVQFHGSRDYFECHEILEEYWKETDSGNKMSHWVGFILLAVSAYHHRRGNFPGAERTAHNSLKIMNHIPATVIHSLGLDYVQLIHMLESSIIKIEQRQPYESMNLPINSKELHEICQSKCQKEGLDWLHIGQVTEDIIHRHTLRDRSEIIKERAYQKALRQQK